MTIHVLKIWPEYFAPVLSGHSMRWNNDPINVLTYDCRALLAVSQIGDRDSLKRNPTMTHLIKTLLRGNSVPRLFFCWPRYLPVFILNKMSTMKSIQRGL
ncbi:DUF3850 domain-containing protein, partial [Alicyclobacillus sp. SP_1]|uniref:DUF3850 domain-containing protein n=1 Tax=Alicyclobacillus sp. SP_1 TaxID=2942475 RepID=UPI0021579ED4